MGPSLCFLSAGLQALAAILAFRLIRKRWSWAFIATAMVLMAVRRVATGLAWPGGPIPLAEWIALAISILALSGMDGLQRLLEQDAELRGVLEAKQQAEKERDALQDKHHEADQEKQASLQRAADLARFLETVVDTADVWINTLDLEGRVVLWNRAAERISGYGRAEVMNRSDIWERLYPDPTYRAEVYGKAAETLRRGEVVQELETTLRTQQGESRVVSWTSRALRDEEGAITGSLAIGRDVTEARRTEQTLQRVHAQQKLILEHNVLGMAFVRDRRIEWANPRAADMLGLPLERIIGAPARIIYPDEATFEAMGKRAYALMAQGIASDDRLRLRRVNGEYFWCRLVGMAVDVTQPYAGSVWLAEDITQQMAAEASLRESEARFRGVFEGTQDAMLLLTPDGIFDCNQRALDLFGFAHKAEMVRLLPADLSPARQPDGGDSRLLALDHVHRAFREGSTRFLWQHRHQDGTLFPVEVLLSTFTMGRRKVLQASVRDLRERRDQA